jgi:hypothetical protein
LAEEGKGGSTIQMALKMGMCGMDARREMI